jgi:Fic family protein
LSELAGLGRTLPNPHLLIEPYVRREAVLSSRIEGTRTSLSELLRDEVTDGTAGPESADMREVRNYVTAMEYGLRRLQELPLSLRLVREIHEKLTDGVRGGHATPGEFRRSQNWIGSSGSTPNTATYVPPPPLQMHEALANWELFLHERDRFPDLIQGALMHEHFEAIHPFLDGNGRVGRLLITLFLIERGRLGHPLLYLSNFIEAHRSEYYDCLLRVRTHGDWTGWILYFLAGVAETAKLAATQSRELMDLREVYRMRLLRHPKALVLVDALLENPYMTVSRAQHILQSTDPTARLAIQRVIETGMLEETTGRSWGRLYLARPILGILESR